MDAVGSGGVFACAPIDGFDVGATGGFEGAAKVAAQ
jgi:hypothetical protein